MGNLIFHQYPHSLPDETAPFRSQPDSSILCSTRLSDPASGKGVYLKPRRHSVNKRSICGGTILASALEGKCRVSPLALGPRYYGSTCSWTSLAPRECRIALCQWQETSTSPNIGHLKQTTPTCALTPSNQQFSSIGARKVFSRARDLNKHVADMRIWGILYLDLHPLPIDVACLRRDANEAVGDQLV